MTALIPVVDRTINNSLVPTVDGRELHAFLGNKDHFSTWITDRIRQFDFMRDVEFVCFSEDSEKGRPQLHYALSLDMAKQLAMVERNEKGREARRYFIECEKKLIAIRQSSAPAVPRTLSEALKLAYEQSLQIEEMTPKAIFYDTVTRSKDELTIGEVAKIIGKKDLGQNKLFKFLVDEEVFYLHRGHYYPYQKHMEAGRFRVVETTWTDTEGEPRINKKVVATQKGLEFISNLVNA